MQPRVCKLETEAVELLTGSGLLHQKYALLLVWMHGSKASLQTSLPSWLRDSICILSENVGAAARHSAASSGNGAGRNSVTVKQGQL